LALAERKRFEKVDYEIFWDDHFITVRFKSESGGINQFQFLPEEVQGMADDLALAVMEFFTDFDEE
jgi:hypothetical protein